MAAGEPATGVPVGFGELLNIALVEVHFERTRGGFVVLARVFEGQNNAGHVEEERLGGHGMSHNTLVVGEQYAMRISIERLVASTG